MKEPEDSKSNFWLQVILINKKYSSFTQKIIKDLQKYKIYIRPGWELMTNLDYFKDFPRMDISIAKNIYKRIINIPSSSFLVDCLKK